MNVGFIGTGVMGGAMASHLQKAGHQLYIYNRTKEKAQHLLDGGAVWCDSPKEVAKQADVIFSIIGMPADVEDVYLGSKGLINHAKEDAILVDMTTSQPELAKRIFDAAKEKGIHAVDAPVSGGDLGAKNGTLTIFVGAEPAIHKRLLPLFEIMGKNIVYLGGAGAGQHGKMANQIAVAGVTAGTAESLAYAKAAGIDLETIQGAVSTGAGGSWHMANMGPRVIAGDFDPGFYIKHFIKDMRIAQNEATKNGTQLKMLDAILKQYETMQEKGYENLGTQALFKLYSE